ncbi:aromatic amino acid hydroxylase [Sphingobacterium endophyticum]|uniref:aromatic amino acid hydroxylase n=1 Tax=Sphingobacterium endophyticum TaxID=2546448 RepID=UPI00293BD958|nr:aromatic amino acid hydroxylase [Sphingobacterium endophyticum]
MMNTYNNPVLENLPKHLRRYVVEQNYDRYSAIDQAIWRYVMRQNYAYLKDIAFYPYIPGLSKAGLTIERIPSLQSMNDRLSEIGWGAVTVDGFIPPAAFMEFQAHCVLVIAADIRQIEHITYTPAPDIIHESSGHAPIIGEPEYAKYLQYFGEVGSKAMSSAKDFELYEAIRALSIIKEKDNAREEEIQLATDRFNEISSNMGEPSEMALLSRLHWWTVEYGLIGTVEDFKIYGAGLLSSIGESATCMNSNVSKLIYSLDTLNYSYDITRPQPQLFVTPDFAYAYRILDEFAEGMSFRVGGKLGMERAVASNNICTVELSSGLQISGKFVFQGLGEDLLGVKTVGATALAFGNKELEGHGKSYHVEGFSSPIGSLLGVNKKLEECSFQDLDLMGIRIGNLKSLYFDSGILVSGKVESILFSDSGQLLLISFSGCNVIHEASGEFLFKSEWGIYDMAVGHSIVSVYSGAADKFAFDPDINLSSIRTEKQVISSDQQELHGFYASIRSARENGFTNNQLPEIYDNLRESYTKDWLAVIELYELAIYKGDGEMADRLEEDLLIKAKENPDLSKLISDGMLLAKTQPINLELVNK